MNLLSILFYLGVGLLTALAYLLYAARNFYSLYGSDVFIAVFLIPFWPVGWLTMLIYRIMASTDKVIWRRRSPK